MQVQHLPIDRTYTDKHSWLALAPGDRFADYPLRAGLTPVVAGGHDILSLELPPVRSIVDTAVPCGAIRVAGQPAYPIYAPISGLITIHNAEAIARPEKVAEEPFYSGWLFAILPTHGSSADGLLTPTRYLEKLSAPV